MNHENEDFEKADKALWDFLGKGRERKASDWFAANVVRAARESGQRETASTFELLSAWLRRRWYLPTAACAILAVAPLFHAPSAPPAKADPLEEFASELAANTDVGMIADLDDLLAQDNHSIWIETEPSSLY